MNYGRLDYPKEKLLPFGRDRIQMEANTEVEQTMRLHACDKEPWTVAVIESMVPGEVFWDIGANVGSYTLLAAARRLMVVAFEPVAENYATLCRNLALNNLLDEVVTLPFGLGPSEGLAWLHRSDMRSGAASHLITDSPRKSSFHKQLTPVMRADVVQPTFKLPLPNVIKLDVDGTEREVLAGAEQLLTCEPLRTLMVELHTQWDGQLTAWLAERGWTVEESFEPRGDIFYARFAHGAPVTMVPVEQEHGTFVVDLPSPAKVEEQWTSTALPVA